MGAAHCSEILNRTNFTSYISIQGRESQGVIPPRAGGPLPPPSREQPLLLFDTHMSIDAFQDNEGGDLGKFLGFDFVEACAVVAAFRNQFGGLNPF